MDKIIYDYLINNNLSPTTLTSPIDKVEDDDYKQLKNNNKTGADQLVYNHTITITAPIPSNSSISSSNINHNNKFDYSILLIIYNNAILLQQQKQQQQQQQQQQQHNHNKHPLKKHQQAKEMDNGSGGDDDYNYKLFKKVWNNKVIRNEIKLHIKLYNVHSKLSINDFDEFCKYKYKGYLRSMMLSSLTIFTNKHCKLLPSSLEKLNLSGIHSFEDNSIPTTISTLVLGDYFDQKLTNNLYNNGNGNGNGNGNNITELVFGKNFNQSLSDDEQQQAWLPRNLTSIQFGRSFQQDILPGQLPNSLTSLVFEENYKGKILPNSIPKSVTTLDYTFNSKKNQLKLNNLKGLSSITNLTFDDDFNQDIKVGDIPHNVTSLTFGYCFNRCIEPGSLPQSLRTLKFSHNFNQPIAHNILPSNLTSLSFGTNFDQPLIVNNRIFIPHSLTHLCFNGELDQTIGVDTFKSFKNLKTLIINEFIYQSNVIVEPFSLPNTITTLDLSGYEGPIDNNRLPTSLTSLTFFYKNKLSIPQNTLPQSITKLYIYGHFKQPIQSLSNLIPPNLKSIYFYDSYDHDLSLIEWPESLESIYITYHNLSIINSIPTQFFNKYIKLIL